MSEADKQKEREAKREKAIAELEKIGSELVEALEAGDDALIRKNGWDNLLLDAGLLDDALEKELNKLGPARIAYKQAVVNGVLGVQSIKVVERNRTYLTQLHKMMRDAEKDTGYKA
jgi:hypothetical protein